jgi:DNA-directed RNA polymerase subunit M/transcription elongation factor TFIIS
MHLTAPLTRRRRSQPTRRPERGQGSTAAAQHRARAQRSGGPEDTALYRCGCGFAFKAEVTTSVDCPHCGADQAW